MTSKTKGYDHRRDLANRIVAHIAQKAARENVVLNEAGVLQRGGYEFRHIAGSEKLDMSVIVSPAFGGFANDAERAANRIFEEALNDPTIGGMFESAGSVFSVHRDGRCTMTKSIRVRSNTAQALQTFEELAELGHYWSFRWVVEVAQIAHGHLPKPARRVTRRSVGNRPIPEPDWSKHTFDHFGFR